MTTLDQREKGVETEFAHQGRAQISSARESSEEPGYSEFDADQHASRKTSALSSAQQRKKMMSQTDHQAMFPVIAQSIQNFVSRAISAQTDVSEKLIEINRHRFDHLAEESHELQEVIRK